MWVSENWLTAELPRLLYYPNADSSSDCFYNDQRTVSFIKFAIAQLHSELGNGENDN